MRKIFTLFTLFTTLLSFEKAIAQIEITPIYGNTFRASYYDGFDRIVFNQAPVFGGMISLHPNKFAELGFSLLNQNSKADAYTLLTTDKGIECGITNYKLNFIGNFPLAGNDKLIPFAGMNFGLVNLYEKTGRNRTVTKASFGFLGGFKIQINELLALRFQGQLDAPISGFGLGFGVGTGGASVGATAVATMVQYSVTAGIGITLPTK